MANLTTVVIFLYTVFAITNSELVLKAGNPYSCRPKNIITMPMFELFDYSRLYIVKKGIKNFVLLGNLTLHQKIFEPLRVSTELYRRDNSEAGQITLTKNQDICGNIPNSANILSYIFNDWWGGSYLSCPIEKGIYIAKGAKLNQNYIQNLSMDYLYDLETTISSWAYSTCFRMDASFIN